jgi:lysophospholipase L1-like esterase
MLGLTICGAAGRCLAGENILANGDFSEGAKAWGGVGSDDRQEVSIIGTGSTKAMKLVRKAAGDTRVFIDQTVKVKPQTLYRFSVTGTGKAPVVIRVRPQSTTDNDYNTVSKSWAFASAPMPPGETPITSGTEIDTGMKIDQVIVMVYLDGKDAGEYTVNRVSLTEVGSAVPGDNEKIVLYLGDSFTNGSYLPFEQRVDAGVREILSKEKVGPYRQISLAADGEYVKDLLNSNRYQKVVKENLARVDVAIIRYGGNDSRYGTPDDFRKQLSLLCDKLTADYPKVKFIMGTGTYLKGNDYVNTKQYGAYWNATREFAAERQLPVSDMYAAFEKAQSDKLTRNSDDMHPSAEGTRLMAETIARELIPLLKTP